MGKFITWRGNSTLNFTQKPILHESLILELHNWIKSCKKKKEKNGNNIVWFYPERALEKAISKSFYNLQFVAMFDNL